MANPSTVTASAASTVVDEAVRIAAEGSRRTTENAQAVLQAGRRYIDFAAQLNRDLFALWSASAEAALQTSFAVQNASFASGEAVLDSSVGLSKEALRRWADLARQAQSTTLNTYQAGSRLVGSIVAA